jgi:hypothetical protein
LRPPLIFVILSGVWLSLLRTPLIFVILSGVGRGFMRPTQSKDLLAARITTTADPFPATTFTSNAVEGPACRPHHHNRQPFPATTFTSNAVEGPACRPHHHNRQPPPATTFTSSAVERQPESTSRFR